MELSQVQKDAINFYEGCCNVLASAGSGKTSVLVNRIVTLIEKHDVAPWNILAITFSKKAKDNMINRLKKLIPEQVDDVNVETFHSFGYRIIRKYSPIKYEILDQDWKKVKIIEEILQNDFREKESDGREIADVLKYISTQKNQMKPPAGKERKDRIYRLYEKYKEKNKLIDFDDMLSKFYEILTTDDKVLSFCQERYRFILADEMQDTNSIQFEILHLIGAKYHNVFFVGDPLQCIYQWRGSDNQHMLDFDKEWPDATIIHLNKNYRSSFDIVDAANHFAQCIPEASHEHYVESIANKERFEIPHYKHYQDDLMEADDIASLINQYIQAGYKYSDIAILSRTNAQLQNFEAALYRSEIPYETSDGKSFVDRREIKIVLCYLRLANDINDDEAFEYIYNRPNRYLGKAFLQEIKKYARKTNMSMYCAMFKVSMANRRYKNAAREISTIIGQLQDWNTKNVGITIQFLRERLNLDSYVSKDLSDDDDSKVENLDSLQRMASRYSDIKKFITFVRKINTEKKKDSNAVNLMTIHKSKGLEFPIVFVIGVNQGLLPHEKNLNINEEKRLMYVAMTRAEKILYITSTGQYNGKDSSESEFISQIFNR